MNGPFFNGTAHVRLPLLALARHDPLVGALVVARLEAARRLAPRRHRMTAARSLALAAAVRVIHRVHRDAAIVRASCPASACVPPCPATRFRDRRCPPGRPSPCIPAARGGFRPRAASAAPCRLRCETNCACEPAERAICAPLPGFSSMLWTTVPAGMFFSGSALPTRMSAVGTGHDLLPDLQPVGLQ